MLVVGLTGGIGSGKTAVSDRFAQLGVPIIDTDVLAREFVAPDQPALAEIAAAFGEAVLLPSGEMNRAYLRDLVFSSPERRKTLEAILHPRIRTAVHERLRVLHAPYCIVVIPLLVETGMYDFLQRVLVVDAPEELQIQRIMARNGLSAAQAQQIVASQASRAQRLARADEIIVNAGSRAELVARVDELHQHYQQLAGSSCRSHTAG